VVLAVGPHRRTLSNHFASRLLRAGSAAYG